MVKYIKEKKKKKKKGKRRKKIMSIWYSEVVTHPSTNWLDIA